MPSVMLSSGTPVRFALLAFLADRPAHGYELKQRFEHSVGNVWPLNVGQVYDALKRLERDGLIAPLADAGGERRPFEATAAGSALAREWFERAVEAAAPQRDEFAIRLLVAQATGIADMRSLVKRQREAIVVRMQTLVQKKHAASEAGELAEVALLDLLILRSQADANWLELLEARFGVRQ